MPDRGLPYPFDCVLNGSGYMLVPEGPELGWDERRVAEVEQTLPLREQDIQYSLAPPRVEVPYVVDDLSGGVGASLQRPDARARYEIAENVDASGGIAVKGPAITTDATIAGGAAGTLHQFIRFNGFLYLVTANKIFKRTAGVWAQVGTDLAANLSGKCVVFRGTQSAPFLFVPAGSGANYYALSTADARTQHASQAAEGFEVVNDQLWLHNTESNQRVIRQCTDGGTAATWGATTVVGDAAYAITWMQNVGGRLIVLKEDGLYGPTIRDESTIDLELTPELRARFVSDATTSGNGRNAVTWDGQLIFGMGGSVYRYDPDSGLLDDLTPSFGSGGSFSLGAAGVYLLTSQPGICVWGMVSASGLTNTHNLFRWGGWRQVDVEGAPQRRFVPAWHGAVAGLSAQPEALFYDDNLGSATSPYLWMYVPSDTTVRYVPIAATHAPADDPNYAVTASAGLLYYPRYTLNAPLEEKVLRRVGLAGRKLSANRTLAAHYRTSLDGAWTAVNSGTNTVTAEPGTTIAASSVPVAKAFDLRVTIAGDAGTTYARLDAFAIYSAVRSQAVKEIVCRVLTSDNVRDRDGAPQLRSGGDMRSALETAIDGNPFTLIGPDGTSYTVLGLDYDHKLEGWDSTGVARFKTTLRMCEVG